MPVDLSKFAEVQQAAETPAVEVGKRVDLAAYADTVPGEKPGPQTVGQEFKQGIAAGTNQMQASLFGLADLAGNVLDSQSLRDYALEGLADAQDDAERLAPTVGQIADIDTPGDFFTWAAGAIGQQVPVLATLFGTGGTGGMIGRVAMRAALRTGLRNGARATLFRELGGTVGRKAVDRAVLKKLDDPAMQRLLQQSFSRGAGKGAAASSFGIQAGDLQNQLRDAGFDSPGTAIVGGGIAAALDAAPVTFLLDRMFPGVDRALSKSFVRDIAKTMGMEGALEGSTEAAQEVVMLASQAYLDPAMDLNSPANRQRVLEAAAAGALVGSLTGGAGEVVSFGPRGKAKAELGSSKLVDFLKQKVELVQRSREIDPTAAAADSAIPGIGELRQAAASAFHETVAPILTEAHERLRAGTQAARDALGSADLGLDIAGLANSLDGKIRARVAPVLDNALQLMHRQIDNVRQQAAQVAGPDRVQFMQDALTKVKGDIQNFIDQRIKPLVSGAENDFVTEAETRNYDGEDTLADDEDPSDHLDPQDLTRVTLGESQKRTRARGNTTVSSTVRTRDDDAVPFATRASARKQLDAIRESFPNLTDDQIGIEQRGDGFVVEIRDIGRAEEIFEQLRLNDGLTDAREAARANSDQSRRVNVKRPGQKGWTRMDLPTLALAGEDIAERGGIELPENHSKRALRGIQTILGRMLDQGYEFEGGATALLGKTLFEAGDKKVSVRRANSASQFDPAVVQRGGITEGGALAQQDPDAREEQLNIEQGVTEMPAGDTPAFDTGLRSEPDHGLGKQANVTETEESANAKTKRVPSQKARRPPRVERKNVRIVLHGVSEKTAEDIGNLVADVVRVTGLRNKVTVVDAQGLQALIDEGHPFAEQAARVVIAKMQQKGKQPSGFIMPLGDEALIFLGDRVLSDKQHGDEERARKNTFAVLTHELGHLVEYTYFRQIKDPALRQALKDEYAKSRDKTPFEEWMANQFASWVANSDKAPKNAVEKFFADVAAVLRKALDAIKKHIGLSTSYKEFADGITDYVAGRTGTLNPYAQHFFNEGTVARVWFKPGSKAEGRKVGTSSMDQTVNDYNPPQMPTSLRAKVKQILDSYPGFKQSAIRAWELGIYLHDQVFSSLNGQLRRMQIPAFDKLADIFNRTPGEQRNSSTYFNSVQMHQAIFAKKFNEILQPLDDAAKQRTLNALINGASSIDPRANMIRKVMDELFEYMRDAGLPIAKVKDYFPRVWDVDSVRAAHEPIVVKLMELGLDQMAAENVYGSMVGDHGPVEENPEDSLDIPFEGFRHKRAKVLDDAFFNQFQSKDLDRTIERYMTGVIKRTEFNRSLGEDAREARKNKKPWNPRGKFDELVADAIKQGATPQQVNQAKDSMDAMLGRTGRNIPVGARQAMAWIATYQNLRLCLFSMLSSFPDIVGPAIRSNDFKSAFKAIRDNWRELVDKSSDINEMGRTWGIISDSLNQHVLTEHFDNHWFPERARKINEQFFRAVGLERWTNFVRAAALAVGRDFIKRSAASGDSDALGQLGLTVSDVQSWIANGEPTFGSATFNTANDVDRKVAQALVQFVNESVMRPNPSQRPLWASNPAFMLLFQLKSFMYAFHDTISRQVYENFKKADTPWQKAMIVAMPAMMMLVLTGLGLELRELLQYKLWGMKAPSDSQGAGDYVFNLVQRAGLLGPSQLAVDWEGAEQRGQLPMMALAGPTVQQVNDFVSDPLRQTVPKALPGMSQMPAFRAAARDLMP